MVTSTSVGNFKESEGKEYTYSKGKQLHIFWGLVPLGKTDLKTPEDKNCEIITQRKFSDGLITFLTLGIVSSQSIKVKAKKSTYENK